jgi:hypothetical protein
MLLEFKSEDGETVIQSVRMKGFPERQLPKRRTAEKDLHECVEVEVTGRGGRSVAYLEKPDILARKDGREIWEILCDLATKKGDEKEDESSTE